MSSFVLFALITALLAAVIFMEMRTQKKAARRFRRPSRGPGMAKPRRKLAAGAAGGR